MYFCSNYIMKTAIITIACFLCLIVAISSAVRPGTKGKSVPMCHMFGCDCEPPRGARCCIGYRYDRRSSQCRKIVRKAEIAFWTINKIEKLHSSIAKYFSLKWMVFLMHFFLCRFRKKILKKSITYNFDTNWALWLVGKLIIGS